MAITSNPSDYKFEIQGTQYFMRFEFDVDVGEVFVAAQLDNASSKWSSFVYKPADKFVVAQHGGIPQMMKFFVGLVNVVLEKNHGTPPEDSLLDQENAFLHSNVVLENERLKVNV